MSKVRNEHWINRLIQYGYVALMMAACTSPTPAPTPSPTSRPAATPTSTPTPTETPYPGDVPGWPTLVHDPTPAGPLLKHGPWLLFISVFDNTTNGTQTISAINADGSGLSQVVSENHASIFAPSPIGSVSTGIDVAYITGIFDSDNTRHAVLKIVHLPDKSEKVLMTISTDHYPYYVPMSRTGLIWSHYGRRIAYLDGSDDGSTDLYVVSLDTEQAVRITSASTHAIHAWWSPDDEYLIYGETDQFPDHFDGQYALWAARSDGSGRPWLLQDMRTYPRVFDWSGPHTAMIGSLGGDYYDHEPVIQQVDLSSGETVEIARGGIRDAAYNPEDQVWVMSQNGNGMGCDPALGQFTVLGPSTNLVIPSAGCGGVSWLDRAPGFLLYPSGFTTRAILLTPDFNQIEIAMPEKARIDPRISDDGQYWAWAYSYSLATSSPGVWISEREANMRQIYDGNTRDFLWVPNSHTLIFGGDVGIYKASAPDFVPALVVSYVSWVSYPQFNQAVWIP